MLGGAAMERGAVMTARRQNHGAATRKRIVQAAITLLVKKGYAYATFEEIARTGRISKGAVQYHFPKLAKLFAEIHDTHMDVAIERWHDWVMKSPGSYAERLDAAASNFLNWSGSDEHL